MFTIHFAYNFLDFLIFKRYLRSFTIEKRWENRIINIIITTACITFLSVVNTIGNPNFNLLCSVICIYTYCYMFNCSIVKSFLPICLYIGLGFVAEPIGFMFALHLAENKISIFYSYTISMFISLVIRFASFEIIRRYRKQKIQNLPINISIIIVGILLLGHL